MFISKKKFQKALEEAVNAAIEKEQEERYKRERASWIDNQIYQLACRLSEIEQKLNIKSKSSQVTPTKKVLNENIDSNILD